MTSKTRSSLRYGLTGTGLLALVLGAQLPMTAEAREPSSSYYVSAPVVAVDPITTRRTVEHPVRQCRIEQTNYRESRRHHYERRHGDEDLFLPGLLGGIVGGLVGNQFGGGSGKKALTIVGALAGSSIARDAARNSHRNSYRNQPREREVCHTRYESEVIEAVTAYDVTYEYAGQTFEKRMSHDPGESVRIRVALEPDLAATEI
ncbi:MAG: glycine zipper 2TM domain-containing protein [Pseudomonadota bacterium]